MSDEEYLNAFRAVISESIVRLDRDGKKERIPLEEIWWFFPRAEQPEKEKATNGTVKQGSLITNNPKGVPG